MIKRFISPRAAKQYAKQLPFGSCYVKGNEVTTANCGGKVTMVSGCGKGYENSVTRVQHYKRPAIRG